ncbi:MAG: hypothetical protein AB7G93_16365 [Bdellovibrionales bacterium]
MTDIHGMLRWNTALVRGLAQTVLLRARRIRTSLAQAGSAGASDPALNATLKTPAAAPSKPSSQPRRHTSSKRRKIKTVTRKRPRRRIND